jgi:predicted lipoprotein with Yx(FWY)xxD motif
MAPKRRAFLGTVAGSVAVAGCLGNSDDVEAGDAQAQTGDDSPTAATDTTDEASDRECHPAVRVREHPDHGPVLVGPDELTLYMFDSDTQDAGESTCYDDCASAWPPPTVAGTPLKGPAVTAVPTTFERDDGATQVAANGWPLYYFQSDERPGDVTGQGVNDVWWVLDAAGTPLRPDDETETEPVDNY